MKFYQTVENHAWQAEMACQGSGLQSGRRGQGM